MPGPDRPIWDDREPPGVDNRRRATVSRPCQNCGKTITATPSKLTAFCHWKCAEAWADLEARFHRKVGPATVHLPHLGPCRDWQGKLDELGYGKIRHGDIFLGAHRVSYEIARGPIAAGLMICHRCSRRCCVEPEHLYAGTGLDNMRDLALDNSGAASKTDWESRFEMARRFLLGEDAGSISADFAVSPETVERWARRFRENDRVPEILALVLRTEVRAGGQ